MMLQSEENPVPKSSASLHFGMNITKYGQHETTLNAV